MDSHFFADFRLENYNRNTTKRKTVIFVKRKSNLFNANREKNIISRQNWTRLHWRALACTRVRVTPGFRTNLGTVNT